MNLDFAFLHMMKFKRQGLAGRKFFLNRLIPAFYAPRVERLISFADFSLQGCNVLLPLGQENWPMLDALRQVKLLSEGESILSDYSLRNMAVDRRLRNLLPRHVQEDFFCFGDEFIKALAAVLSRETISRHTIRRIIVLGAVPGMEQFLAYLSTLETPITVQNSQPGEYEMMVYRLLYEKGLAVSNSSIQPQLWSSGDLILAFEAGYDRFTLANPGIFYFRLNNESHGLAPFLEHTVEASGLDTGLNTLAPIFESCLLSKAGFNRYGREIDLLENNISLENPVESLIETGNEIGLWEAFLDKGI